jgi:hypothetical protein
MCPGADADHPNVTLECLAGHHLLGSVAYQPSGRIPVFHLILASGHLGLAVVALAAVWLIVRRTNLSAG